jgi:2-polyprenyl-3-methyl-5-hydroxy-6-metoxy-1,4-benzoquinol methylase
MRRQVGFRKFAVLAALFLLGGTPGAFAFQLGARDAEEWIRTLERPERIASLKIDEVLARLDLKPGMVVADIGAGTGVFSRPFARAVAPGGKVYAVDVDQGLVDYIAQRAQQENLTNLHPVLGEFGDPKLPSRDVDVAFFHDVLHHIEHRETYLSTLASYLKSTARIVLIEIDPANPAHPHREHVEREHGMQLSKESAIHWLAALGFHPVREFDLFKGEKWFVIFERQVHPVEDDMEMHMH